MSRGPTRYGPGFKPRPWSPERDAAADKRTAAQKAATERNFGIFKLRGLWYLMWALNEPFRTVARALVDADLVTRGAKSQTQHIADQHLQHAIRRVERLVNEVVAAASAMVVDAASEIVADDETMVPF